MSYEINDSLTDVCPQCALKHLSAAMAYIITAPKTDDLDTFAVRTAARKNWSIDLARALINIAEWSVGYKSHIDYAIGLLVMAEERIVTLRGCPADVTEVRRLRNVCQTLRDSLGDQKFNDFPFKANDSFAYLWCTQEDCWSMARAHLMEAERELPGKYTSGILDEIYLAPVNTLVQRIQNAIKDIKADYFDVDGGEYDGEYPSSERVEKYFPVCDTVQCDGTCEEPHDEASSESAFRSYYLDPKWRKSIIEDEWNATYPSEENRREHLRSTITKNLDRVLGTLNRLWGHYSPCNMTPQDDREFIDAFTKLTESRRYLETKWQELEVEEMAEKRRSEKEIEDAHSVSAFSKQLIEKIAKATNKGGEYHV